jgi:hypothetical protein
LPPLPKQGQIRLIPGFRAKGHATHLPNAVLSSWTVRCMVMPKRSRILFVLTRFSLNTVSTPRAFLDSSQACDLCPRWTKPGAFPILHPYVISLYKNQALRHGTTSNFPVAARYETEKTGVGVRYVSSNQDT